jgi:hypothetical protein
MSQLCLHESLSGRSLECVRAVYTYRGSDNQVNNSVISSIGNGVSRNTTVFYQESANRCEAIRWQGTPSGVRAIIPPTRYKSWNRSLRFEEAFSRK